MLLRKHDVRINLLKTNVATKKRNTNLAFLLGDDTATMDDEVKVWYLAEARAHLESNAGTSGDSNTTAEFYIAEFYNNTIAELCPNVGFHFAKLCPNGRGAFYHGGGGADSFISTSM